MKLFVFSPSSSRKGEGEFVVWVCSPPLLPSFLSSVILMLLEFEELSCSLG